MNKLHILDVFAEEKYAGNQLAVVRVKRKLSDSEMQKIAREINFSETTFILSDVPQNRGYDVRIFTPQKEIPFAGHPTIGTAYIIQKEIIKKPVKSVILNLKVGQIPVALSYRGGKIIRLTMKQMEPTFGRRFDIQKIAEVLSSHKSEIDDRFPIEEVSTGLPFIIVPLKTLNAVKMARIEKEKYYEMIKDIDAKAILIFSPETYRKENHLNVRMFAPYYGISEDPATGSANGCLAGYLVKHRYFDKDRINVRVEQGYEIGRPSLLFLKANMKGEKIEIYVGGKVIGVINGILL
ncbi:MAG: PhzF family phenazine biosynthesis protein [Nitrospinae bacterium]|nr:PhzF family phenazine biosynthesis protein [Nitrospinota bacterium]